MSAATAFMEDLKNGPGMEPDEDVFNGIWEQYERVIIRSLITSFGLDFLVKDQHGGDVDTVHNVRQIGNDPNMKYKNKQNETDYEKREKYDTHAYHNDPRFKEKKRQAKQDYDTNGIKQEDGYVPGNTVIPRNNKTIPRGQQGQVDHKIPGHKISNDRGRVLSGLDGVELANSPENLVFTNAALNLNKRDMTVEEYISWCEENPDKVNWRGKKGEPLPEEVKQKLREEYNESKKAYDAKIERAYYTSSKFAKDTAVAAGKIGAQMGLREVLGFVFAEVWFTVKEELQNMPENSELIDMLKTAGNGIKKGFENARKKYKEIMEKLQEGFVAGALSSITTTICNIFFTTAKNLVKCIRQIWASIVQAGKVLLFNPDNLMFGERIKTATVILGTGASVLVGTAVGEAISKTPIGAIPVIGTSVSIFCSSLVSGLMSCTLLICLDRSKLINSVIKALNAIPSEANNYRKIAEAMEQLAAKFANLDIDKFKAETKKYASISNSISKANTEEELNHILMDAYRNSGISIPWKGDFDSFMSNKSNHLVFS